MVHLVASRAIGWLSPRNGMFILPTSNYSVYVVCLMMQHAPYYKFGWYT
jgi:hypothetical protein